MTFTRASTATRVNRDGLIEYVASGVPRVEKANYLPLEPARTNLFQRSEDFSNAYWSKTNVTIDADAEIAPDGRQTADGIRETTTNSFHSISRNITTFSGGSAYYTVSVFAKAGGTRVLTVYSGTIASLELNVNFDLEAGTATAITGTASIEAFPNGWYRCIATGISASAGSSGILFGHRNAGGSSSYAGDPNEVTYLWGAQIEAGNHASSYIPTFSSTVTRVAETCRGGTGNFSSTEGVFFVDIQALSDTYIANRYITLSDGTTSNMLYVRYSNTGDLGITNVGSSLSSSIYSTNLDLSQRHKIAVQYGTQTEDYKVFINGEEKVVSGSFSAQIITGLDTLDLDYSTGSNPFIGKVRQVLVYSKPMTDAQLIELTR